MGYIEGTSREQTMMMTYNDLVENKSLLQLIDRFVEVCKLENMGFCRTKPVQTGRSSYDPASRAMGTGVLASSPIFIKTY